MHTDVAVIGAGLAGLTAARIAQRSGARVVVLDGQPSGGRARTDHVDGFAFNRGPHALYGGGAAERILGELGVRISGGPPASESFGLLASRINRLPGNALTLLTTHLVGFRAKAALGKLLGGLAEWEADAVKHLTVREWIDDMHLPSAAALVMEMLVRVSTYGNAPDVMSAQVAVGQLQMALSTGVRYLDGGWQTLVDQLAGGVDIRRDQAVSVLHDGEQVVIGTATDGHVIADAVVVASGTPASVAGLLGRRPFDVGPPIEAACLDLGIAAAPRHPVLFGVDVPLYASVHCPPARLAPAGMRLLHVARYLAAGDALRPGVQRGELHEHALRTGVTDADIVTSRYLHRMTVVSAMSTAAAGGFDGRVQVGDAGVDGVFIAGDWIGREGHLADASVASAAEAARLATVRVRARA